MLYLKLVGYLLVRMIKKCNATDSVYDFLLHLLMSSVLISESIYQLIIARKISMYENN